MDSDKWSALRQERTGLTELISGLVVEINEHTRLIELLGKRPPCAYTQARINQERLATIRLSRQCRGLIRRVAVIELILAVGYN